MKKQSKGILPKIAKNSEIKEVIPEKERKVIRPNKLDAIVYKIESPKLNSALYVTISKLNGKPYELFIYTKDLTKTAEFSMLGRLVSAIFRAVPDPSFIIDELNALYDVSGGYFSKGRYMKSIYAEIGLIIEEELKSNKKPQNGRTEDFESSHTNTLKKEEVLSDDGSGPLNDKIETNLMLCPQCGNMTAKYENGCQSCIDPECGYSKCDH